MVVDEQQLQIKLPEGNFAEEVRNETSLECCFVCDSVAKVRPIPGTIEEVCAVDGYLQSAREYKEIRRLEYNWIVKEKYGR